MAERTSVAAEEQVCNGCQEEKTCTGNPENVPTMDRAELIAQGRRLAQQHVENAAVVPSPEVLELLEQDQRAAVTRYAHTLLWKAVDDCNEATSG